MNAADTLTALTAEIAASFVTNNRVAVNEIGGMISSIHEALAGLGKARAPEEPKFVPAVTIRKSLANPTKIISMIDGKPYSVLKRHLTTHGLTPAEYRARYRLPADYPMTAPAYSEKRKAMALQIGLGRKPGQVVKTSAAAVTPKAARGRPKKAE